MLFLELSEAIEKQILSMMFQTPTKFWKCLVCSKESKSKVDICRHVESVHITDHPGYNCSYCYAHVKSKNALRLHMKRLHYEES